MEKKIRDQDRNTRQAFIEIIKHITIHNCQVIVAGLNLEVLWFPSATAGCISTLTFVLYIKTQILMLKIFV
jgi:hypothetical protein